MIAGWRTRARALIYCKLYAHLHERIVAESATHRAATRCTAARVPPASEPNKSTMEPPRHYNHIRIDSICMCAVNTPTHLT